MIQFSVRQLDTIKNPVLDKVLLLYKFYLVSFIICLVACLAGLSFLILSAAESCPYQQMHIFTIISVVFYFSLVLDMFLSEKATLKFFNDNCSHRDLAQNLPFKTFLSSVERLRYYSNQRDVSVFQVREVLWNSIQIRYHKLFFMSQVVCWILYGISFFFAINQVGKGCVHKQESLIIFIVYLYHNFWFIILIGFSVVVSVSAVIFLPFLICAYFKYSDKNEFPTDPEQQQKVFLQTQLENFKYNIANAKDTLCAICLEDFQAENPLKRTKCCKSIYHPICIQEWVANSISCPNCRQSPFTKKKDHQDDRVDSVVPLNSNPVNNQQEENNENNANQDNNPVLEGQNNPVGDVENQDQQDNLGVDQLQQDQNINLQNELPHSQQQNIEIIVAEVPIKNTNNNELNQDSYIIQFSEKSIIIPKIKEIIELDLNKNEIEDNKLDQPIQIDEQDNFEPIQIDEQENDQPIQIEDKDNVQPIQIEDEDNQIRNIKDRSLEVEQIQHDLSRNSKERKKHFSSYTNGEIMMNNHLNSELQGQRLTIHCNMDANAVNSTEISTLKVPIQSKQFDFHNHNIISEIQQYELADFDNIQEFKEEIDMR